MQHLQRAVPAPGAGRLLGRRLVAARSPSVAPEVAVAGSRGGRRHEEEEKETTAAGMRKKKEWWRRQLAKIREAGVAA